MFNNSKISLGYHNVILQHNKGIVKSRSECDTSVTVGGVKLEAGVWLSNMEYLQKPNPAILDIFNKRKWGYIYHRLGGVADIYNFVFKINKEKWHFKSISIGMSNDDWVLLNDIKSDDLKLDCITVDLAFCYNNFALEFISKVRKLFPDVYLIAGNFDSHLAAMELERIGVDCGKIGIGTSVLCKTRQRIGVATAMISDLVKCKENTSRIHFMADGGLQTLDDGEIAIGDAWKAMNFGAKFVLSSSLFKRVKELAGQTGEIHCYGNSTARAKGHDRNDEGTEMVEKTDGKTLEEQMNCILDSCKSFCSYAGINKISDAYQSCDYKIVI